MALFWGGALCAALAAPAEQLAVRLYTTADGLAGDQIRQVMQDSRGFLWVATASGLSRFDGYRFENYGKRQGLPSETIEGLLETRDGALWVATSGGLARFNAGPMVGEASFAPAAGLRAARAGPLYEDRAGRLWAGTIDRTGLFELSADRAPRWSEIDLGLGSPAPWVTAVAEDGEGALWVGTICGLARRLPSGRWVPSILNRSGRRDNQNVHGLATDRAGRLWIATFEGVYVRAPGPAAEDGRPTLPLRELAEKSRCLAADGRPRLPTAPGEVCRFVRASGVAGNEVEGVWQSRAGSVWIATKTGLTEFDGSRFRSYTHRDGLAGDWVSAWGEDREGNLWLGTESRGLMRVARHGFANFGRRDGLVGSRVVALVEDGGGELFAFTEGSPRGRRLLHFDGRRFADVSPALFGPERYLGWGWNQVVVAGRAGEWWFATGRGLLRFPRPAAAGELPRLPATAEYGARQGLGSEVFRLFEDARGDLWISTFASGLLTRWERSTGTFARVPEIERLGRGPPTAFAEDAAGNLWMGFYLQGLARWRAGRAELFGETDGVPAGFINALLRDHRNRLWVATAGGGVARVDDPTAAHPRFVVTSSRDGLSSDRVLCLAEDRQGLIYLGTGRGVDRLDPATGQVRRFTVADGLAASTVTVALRARDGSLWFGTVDGLSRYVPETEAAVAPPPIFLTGVRIGGAAVPLPPGGTASLAGLEVPPGRDPIEVAYVGLSLSAGASLRYQYRLAGSRAGWSSPAEQRAIVLSGLGAGGYRLLVRAVGPEGMASPAPAVLAFTVLRPFWQRGWFLALAALALGALAAALHQIRVRRLVGLERLRMRIAGDLHDDVGSGLSRIALLSELGRRQMAAGAGGDRRGAPAEGLFTQIGDSSRDLIEATGDIVWAIDPRHEHLGSLLARLRRFASDLLEAQGVRLTFETPPAASAIVLRPEQRRDLYLLLKEAIHNVARHAAARTASVRLSVTAGELVAEVRDDGVGFAAPPAEAAGDAAGHGLASLRQRTGRLRGTLRVQSAPGAGTRVELTMPL